MSLIVSFLYYLLKGHNLQKFINIDHLPAAVVPRELVTIDEENQLEDNHR